MARTYNQIKNSVLGKNYDINSNIKSKKDKKELTYDEIKSGVRDGKYNFSRIKSNLESEIRFDTLESDISSLGKTLTDSYDSWQTQNAMSNTRLSIESMKSRIGAYQEYRKLFGNDDMPDLSDLTKGYNIALDEWDGLTEKYGKYKNADAYTKEKNTLTDLYSMDAKQLEGKKGVAYTTADGYNIKWEDLYNDALVTETTKQIQNSYDVDEYGAYKKKSVKYESSTLTPQYKVVSDADAHLYNLVNGDEDAMNYEELYNVHMSNTNDDTKYRYVTEEERKIFNTIWETQGGDKAKEYLELISPYLRQQKIEHQRQYTESMAKESPLGASVATVLANIGNNAKALPYIAIDYADNGSIDSDDPLYTNRRMVQTTRSTIENDVIDSKTGKFFYRHGMNIADNLALRAVSVGMGTGIASQFIMSSGAFADTVIDAKERGLSDAQALGLGTISGAAEWFFESKGFEAWVDKKTLSKSAWEYFANNLKTELVGEIFTEGVNDISDIFIAQDLNKLNTEYQSYLAKGLSEKESFCKVVNGVASRYVDVVAGTILSTGVMAGPSATIGGIQQSNYNKYVGRNIKANERTAEVFDMASISPEASSAYDTYTMLANKGISAENVSDYQLGMLATDMRADAEAVIKSKKSTEKQKTQAKKTIADLDVYGQNNPLTRTGSAINRTKDFFKDFDEKNIEVTDEDGNSKMVSQLDLLIESGLESAEGTEAFKLATEYKAKLEQGKNISIKEIQKLYDANDAAIRTEENSEVATRLTELGESEEVAELVARKSRGETITQAEAEKILESDVAVSVLAETSGASVESVKTEELLTTAQTMDKDKGALFISLYDGNTDVEAYANHFNAVVAKAENGFSIDDILTNHGNVLSGKQIAKIFSEVRIKTDYTKRLDFQKLSEKTAKLKAYKAVIDDSIIDYNNTSAKGKINWNDSRITDRMRKAITFIKGFAQATGINLKLVADETMTHENGSFNVTKNEITIDIFAGKSIDYAELLDTIIPTMSHEVTHWIEQNSPVLYRKISRLVFSTLQKKDGMTESERIAQEIDSKLIKEYKKKNPDTKLDDKQILEKIPFDVRTEAYEDSERISEARSEIVARGCEDMLARSEVGREMFNSLNESEQKSLTDKIKEIIQNIKDWVSNVLGLYESNSREARAMREFDAELNKLSKLWDEALKEAIEVNQAREKSGAFGRGTTDGVILNQSREYDFGVLQSDIDLFVDNSYKKSNEKDYIKYLIPSERLIKEIGNNEDISEYVHALRDNDIRHIKNSHGEQTNEKYPVTKSDIAMIPFIVENYDKVFYKTNARGEGGIVYVKVMPDNIVYYVESITTEYHKEKLLVNKQMVKTGIDEIPNLHGLIDAINKKQSSTQYLADLKEIRKAYVQDVKEYHSDDSIPNPDEKVKDNFSKQDSKDIRFQMRENVEETRDLVAVHNLSAEKLLKTIKLGGLPMPSIAITRAREGYNNFGAISLVFGKETIDPKFFRSNKVYSGDAWTPTYPQIAYKVNTKAQESIEKKMYALVPSNVRNDLGGLHLDSANLEYELNRSGDMVQSYRYNYAMKYAFLKDKGIDIELPTKDEPLYRYGEVSNDAVISFSHKIVDGLKTVNSLLEQHSSKLMEDTGLIEGIASVLNEEVLSTVEENTEAYQKMVKEPLYKPEDIDLSTVLGMLEASRKYFHTNGRIESKVDYREARTLIDEKVDMSEYESWLKELFSDIIAKEGIRNNKDLFTPSGNRRSFEALHYEHTLENVIKAMKEEGTKGIGGFGGGNIFGASTREYDSIDDIKADAQNRMQQLPESQYDEIKKGFSDRLFELANSLPIHKDSFSALDDAANMLIEAVSKFKTKSGIANYLRTESKGWANYSDYIVDDLVELVNDIRNMPVAYFEAKPQRAVGFDEIKAVIMPSQESYEDDLSEVKGEVEKLGIPVLEYEYGDNNSRIKALNSLEKVRFQSRDSEYHELAKDTVKNEARLKEMVEEAAKEDGYTVRAYHGTGADFNIFTEESIGNRNVWGKGFYFGTSKGIADDYASWRESKGGKYRIVSALLRMDNPFIPHKSNLGTAEEILDRWFPDMWKNTRELGIGYIEGKLNNSPIDLLQFIAEHNNLEIRDVLAEYGFDSIKDGGELVVFNCNQIKSADPVTYDDDGNIIPLSERFNTKKNDIRYQTRNFEDGRVISVNMSEDERYEILKNKTIENIPMVKGFPSDILQKFEEISSWEDINKLSGTNKRHLIHKIAQEFGVFKEYNNSDINISFGFSNRNFSESYGKQKRNFETFAKMFSVFDKVIENAIGIEMHNRNNDGYKTDVTLNNVYVLISAFEDGELIVPVKLEVKEFKDKQNTLYVAISLEAIKKTEVSKQGTTENSVAQNSHSVTISISDIFKNVNTKDGEFLKYIPNQFLNAEQIEAKNEALEKDKSKYSPKILKQDRQATSVYDTMGETERLRKENEKLRTDIERLREMNTLEKRVTNGAIFNTNQIGVAAGHIRNISKSNIDKVELMKSLKGFYSYIAESPELAWEDVYGRAYRIAEDVLAESKPEVIGDEYSSMILSEIKNTRISLSETQKTEARHRFGGHWNRNFFGRANITNEGIRLESQWQEWAEMYPDIFDADISESEMVSELYDILGDLKSATETIAEYDTAEQTRWLASEIYNTYWNVSTIKTTADKYSKKIVNLKAEHKKTMKELRDNYNERAKKKADMQKLVDDMYYGRILKDKDKELARQKIANDIHFGKIISNLKKKRENEVLEAKVHGKQMLDKYKENAEKKTYIQRITSNALSLNELLVKNSKDKHIPEIMRGPVTSLLQAIDFSSKRMLEKGIPTQKDISLSKALSKVKDMMVKASNAHDELVELYGHGLDEKIEKMMDSVDNIMRTVGDNEFILNAMTVTDLQTLDKMVKTIKHSVNKLNKFHTVNHAKGIANLSQESMLYLDSLGNGNIHDGLRGKIEKLLNWDNALPYYAFKRFGSGGIKVFEAMQDGWDKFAFNTKKIIDFANETFTSKEIKEWSEKVKTFKILIPASEMDIKREDYTPQYQEVQLTVPQIMSMYCLNKREQARLHLFQGGIRVADFKDAKGNIVSQADGIVFTEKDIQTILDSLTERQKDVADKLQEFMNTVCTDWGNYVSMARFGYKAFGEENYFPIQSDGNNIANDEKEQINSLFKLLNMSFTKSTEPKANNRIVISDIFDVFAQHTSDMAKYNALALPVLDSFKWYNYTEKQNISDGTFKTTGVKQSIEKAFGRDGQNYFTTFLKDINGQQDVSRDIFGKGFFSNAKIAAVGANLRVVLLQPTSYARASAVIDNKYLTKALLHKPKIKKAETHCGIALWKSMGYYDTNIQRGVEAQIKHNDTWKDKATEWSMKGAENADKITWGYLWNACELEIRETRPDLKVGSQEFYDAISKRLRDVIYSTQVVDSIMTRSKMMRSTDGRDKMLTAFASEPTLSYNMLQDAYMEYSLDARRMGKKEAVKKNIKRIARVVYAYTMTNAAAALVESAFDAFREDDDEEMDMIVFMKLYFKNFAFDMSIGNKIPYIKDLYSLLQGYSSSRLDTQWAQYLYSAINTKKPSKFIRDTIRTASQIFGLPFYSIYRDTMALLNKLDLFTEEDLNEMFEDFID